MKLSLVQFAPHYSDKQKNMELIVNHSKSIDSDIIVFPELSTSGYYFTDKNILKNLSIEYNSDYFNDLQEIASKKDKLIILGFPEKVGENIFNSAIILFPEEGKRLVYRKNHLFYKESKVFEKGDNNFFVFDYKGVKIGPMICYDWRFPEAARTLALKGADLIICPSNLVTGVWQNVMSARALENKVYVAVANRIGHEEINNDILTFNGESAIYKYNGEYLAKAGEDSEEVISAEFNAEKTRDKSFNEFNDIFADRREDIYFK